MYSCYGFPALLAVVRAHYQKHPAKSLPVSDRWTDYMPQPVTAAAVDKNLAEGKPTDDGINMGLYTYPTLMAADILSMDTDIVPVGKDQIQHVEIARDIAGAVNAYYDKELLKLPTYVTADNVAVLPGIDGRKMSKSYNNVIPLFADEKTLKKAVYSTVTDSTRLRKR